MEVWNTILAIGGKEHKVTLEGVEIDNIEDNDISFEPILTKFGKFYDMEPLSKKYPTVKFEVVREYHDEDDDNVTVREYWLNGEMLSQDYDYDIEDED